MGGGRKVLNIYGVRVTPKIVKNFCVNPQNIIKNKHKCANARFQKGKY